MKILKYLETLLLPTLLRKQRKSYFRSIDTLPMWNWSKIQETNNYKWLSLDFTYEDFSVESMMIFNSIFAEYISEFGIGEEYTKLLMKKRDLLIAHSEYLISDNKEHKMRMKFLQVDVDDLADKMKGKEHTSEAESTIVLEQNLGVKLNLREITVKEYYNYVKFFTKRAKELKNG